MRSSNEGGGSGKVSPIEEEKDGGAEKDQ